MSTGWDMGTSGLEAAILEFPLTGDKEKSTQSFSYRSSYSQSSYKKPICVEQRPDCNPINKK